MLNRKSNIDRSLVLKSTFSKLIVQSQMASSVVDIKYSNAEKEATSRSALKRSSRKVAEEGLFLIVN